MRATCDVFLFRKARQKTFSTGCNGFDTNSRTLFSGTLIFLPLGKRARCLTIRFNRILYEELESGQLQAALTPTPHTKTCELP